MTTNNQPISAACAAALLLNLLPELARAELYPQWSDGGGETVRRQRVTLYDATGDIVGADQAEHRSVLRVLQQVEGGDWDRPQTFSVAGESLFLTFPVVSAAPLWLSPAAAGVGETGWVPNGGHDADCAYVGGLGGCTCSPAAAAPSAGALLEQRHQLEDPAEPPLAVADPARDCAASLDAGLMQPVVWGDDAPVCVPEFVQRPTVDVPVVGGAL